MGLALLTLHMLSPLHLCIGSFQRVPWVTSPLPAFSCNSSLQHSPEAKVFERKLSLHSFLSILHKAAMWIKESIQKKVITLAKRYQGQERKKTRETGEVKRKKKKKSTHIQKTVSFSFWKRVSGKKIFSFRIGVHNGQLPTFVSKGYSGPAILTAREYRELVGLWGGLETTPLLWGWEFKALWQGTTWGKAADLRGLLVQEVWEAVLLRAAMLLLSGKQARFGLWSFPDELQLLTCQFMGRGNPPFMVSTLPLVPPP